MTYRPGKDEREYFKVRTLWPNMICPGRRKRRRKATADAKGTVRKRRA